MDVIFPVPDDPAALAEVLETIPNQPAVFLLWPRTGPDSPPVSPTLLRTNVLRRRLAKLLGGAYLGLVERVEYHPTGSRLETQFVLLELARTHFGPARREHVRLRFPYYLRLAFSNAFPRTRITRRLTLPDATVGARQPVTVGPFQSRSTAAAFESEFLDLFQLRRCQENLAPSPRHPGCIYGEMNRCLRPCQQAVGPEEYLGEAARVALFLNTGGRSLLDSALAARERASAEMDFEGAAMLHQRVKRIEAVEAVRDEMARPLEHLHAVAVLPAASPTSITLGWLKGGVWSGFTVLDFDSAPDPDKPQTASLDTRLRETAAALAEPEWGPVERMEHLALLSRWFYSSSRDGELLLFDDWGKPPYRKLVNAVSRVSKGRKQASEPSPDPPPTG